MINFAVGIWLMAAPGVLGYGPPAMINDRIVGPIIATFACVAIWEATRPLRWVNLPLGLWLIIAPWVLGYEGYETTLNDMGVGILAALLSLVRGRMTHRFNGGWSMLWAPAEKR